MALIEIRVLNTLKKVLYYNSKVNTVVQKNTNYSCN